MINALRDSTGSYHPGWGGPEYTTWQDEQMSWKKTCYIGDWSFLGNYFNLLFEGPEALKLVSDISVNSFANFEIEQGKHIIQCNDDGKIISLTYIDVKYSKPGTKVVIVWGNPGTPQKRIRATVAPAPYKKDNRRIDVTKLPSYL
jgi:glycine cleavage system aminomethyltransferase T